MEKVKPKYSRTVDIYSSDCVVITIPDFYCRFDTKDHVSVMLCEADIKIIIEGYQNYKAKTRRIIE